MELEGPTFGEAVKGVFSGAKGFGTFGFWCFKNWKTVAFIASLFTGVADQVVGPHYVRQAWHGIKHGQATETADESWNKLYPVLNSINSHGQKTDDDVILLTNAFKHLPGGPKAMNAAIKQRYDDSVAEAQWHPQQQEPPPEYLAQQNESKMATIKPRHWFPED